VSDRKIKYHFIYSRNRLLWPKSSFKNFVFANNQVISDLSEEEKKIFLESETINHHWMDRSKFAQDFKSLENSYEKFLINLSNKLNTYHGENFPLSYWRMLLGPWLWFFSVRVYDYFSTLEELRRNKRNFVTTISSSRDGDANYVPNGAKDFFEYLESVEWNEAIYSHLIKNFYSNDFEIEFIPILKDNTMPVRPKKSQIRKDKIRKFLGHFQKYIARKDKYFLLNTYLPRDDLKEILKDLGQKTIVWKEIPPFQAKDLLKNRDWILEFNSDDKFEKIMEIMIPLHFPILYLEGYSRLKNQIRSLPWPKDPKVIFTSNSFFSDDVFKFWAADKINSGAELVIGQHGGSYGIGLFLWNEAHEIEISKKWLSWGWAKPNKSVVPVGNFKNRKENKDNNHRGGMLHVLSGPSNYPVTYSFPIDKQWDEYFENQLDFFNHIDKKISDISLIRFDRRTLNNAITSYWFKNIKDNFKYTATEVDNGDSKFGDILSNYRICVVTYNATTFLETLSMDFPTIIFWNIKHWEIRSDAKPYFEILESVGIFHRSYKSAAIHINSIWDDVSGWWNSKNVQNAKKKFISNYSLISKDTNKKIINALIG